MDTLSRTRSFLRRRWWLVLVLVLLLPTWVLLLNVMLWTGSIEAIVTRDGKNTQLELRHGWAWVVWPTRVHVHDFELDVDAHSYQLALDIDEALVDIELVELLDRRVHFESIEAKGARVWYRDKVDAEEADDPDLAAYPRFDGEGPEVQSDEPRPVPEPGEEWRVDLDDIDAQLDTLWIDEFDVEPCGYGRGALHWADAGEFSVPETTIELVGATLWLADREAIRSIDGDGVFELAAFDSGSTEATSVPASISFSLAAAAELSDPIGLSVWWPDLEQHVAGGRGELDIDVEAVEGQLQPGSRVKYVAPWIGLGPVGARTFSKFDSLLSVDEHGHPRVAVSLANAELRDGDEPIAHTSELRGTLALVHGRMDQPWAIDRAHVETETVEVERLAAISEAAHAESWALTRGSGQAQLHADLDRELTVTAEVTGALKHARLTSDDVRVAGDVRFGGTVKRTNDGHITSEDLELHTKNLALHTDDGDTRDTWVDLERMKLDVKGDKVVLDVHGKVEDSRPALEHLTRLDPIVHLVPDLEHSVAVKLHARVLLSPQHAAVEIVRAQQLGLVASASWHRNGDRWRAAVLFSGITALGYEIDRTGSRAVGAANAKWFAERKRWVAAVDPSS